MNDRAPSCGKGARFFDRRFSFPHFSQGGCAARNDDYLVASVLSRPAACPIAVFDLLMLLDQAKSTKNSVRRKTSDRFFGKYPAPSIRRFPARSRFTTFLLHNTVYEFAARTYYPRRISKSGSDAPLILHYGIALSVIITNYNRLHPDEPFIRWI